MVDNGIDPKTTTVAEVAAWLQLQIEREDANDTATTDALRDPHSR